MMITWPRLPKKLNLDQRLILLKDVDLSIGDVHYTGAVGREISREARCVIPA